MSSTVSDKPFDIIIVGAGTAGLPAAIFAARRGARVLLIDAAKVVGGTLHLANGQVSAGGTKFQKSKGIIDSPDQHFADVMHVTHGLADPDIVRLTVDQAPATMDWLLDAGLTPLADHPVTGDQPGRPAYTTPRYFWGAEQGRSILAVIERELAPEVASGRIQIKLESRVTKLITSDEGAVTGVCVRTGEHEHTYNGRHVLLTTGGYAMNPELFEHLIGQPSYGAGAYPTALGDALKLITDIGGTLRGHDLHRPGSGSILTAEKFPAKFYARFNTTPQLRAPWEIWVNNAGQRFVREDEPDTYTRDRGLISQDQFRYAIVFDDEIFHLSPPGVTGWTREKMTAHFNTHPMFHSADTLAQLAAKAGINPQGLADTIAAYNAGVQGGHDSCGRQHLPHAILKPPFYAIIHLGHSATSSVGVVVDKHLRVTRANGQPIPGLFAAGEVLGSGATLGAAFAPGMMLTPALALGRWLGQNLPL